MGFYWDGQFPHNGLQISPKGLRSSDSRCSVYRRPLALYYLNNSPITLLASTERLNTHYTWNTRPVNTCMGQGIWKRVCPRTAQPQGELSHSLKTLFLKIFCRYTNVVCSIYYICHNNLSNEKKSVF